MKRWILGALLGAVSGCGSDGSDDSSTADGAMVFNENAVDDFKLSMEPADWDALVADPHARTPDGRTLRYRCDLEWRGKTWADVAIRASGQNSRITGNPKPSIVLNFEEYAPGRHFDGLSSLKLNYLLDDPSFMRQRLLFGMARERGLAAPRDVHGRLYVNGSYKGLYGVTERITRSFVRRQFGDTVNQLYKKGLTGKDLEWQGESHSYAGLAESAEFEPEIDSLPDGNPDLRELYRTLNFGTYEEIERVFDVDAFLNFLAIEIICGEDDGYRSGPSGGNSVVWSSNFYLYKVPSTNRYRPLFWDRGETYWRAPDEPITHTFERRVLTRRLILERAENLDRLREILREILAGPSELSHMTARLEQIRSLIAPDIPREPANPVRNPWQFGTWTQEVDGLRDTFIRERILNLQTQLQ